ncbi:hypothetical protein [Actinomadura chokoriensis]|uniref:Uncharacterized protein n=1 Tax=Actinomadura chokoriensis TaxID=454156 RepID=A0ABV4R085_9ACTN
MGADSWTYLVPFQPDVAAALAALRQQEFHDTVTSPGWPAGWPRPSTIDQFRALMDETHSSVGGILELDGRLIGPGGQDDFLAVRLLSPAEVRAFFGTDHPTRDDFERAYAAHPGLEPDRRDQGRCTVLYDRTGEPAQIAFWGISGD